MSDQGDWIEPPAKGQQLPVGEAVDSFTMLRPEQGNLAALKGYLYNSLQGLSRAPGDIKAGLEDFSRNVAVPYLENYGKVPDGPLLGVGQGGELTGRLPALASAVAPFIAGAAPPGALGAGSRLPGGVTGGWHGTPHLFEPEEGAPLGRFRNEAIGSGEGAQAYAWGHYVAGNPAVAETYIPSGKTKQLQLNGQPPNQKDLAELSMKAIADHGSIGQEALDDIHLTAPFYDSIEQYKDAIGDMVLPAGHEDIPFRNAQFSILDHMQEKGYDIGMAPGGGHLLEVHILPEEHELLDWDKPLSEQPEGVQQLMKRLDNSHGPFNPSDTGENIYRTISARAGISDPGGLRGKQGASALLDEAGIPGIRYLDQGSRIPAAMTPKDIAQLQESIGNAQNSIEEIQKEVDMNRNNPQLLPAFFSNRQEQIDQRQSMIDMWKQKLDDLQNERHLTHNYVIFHPDNLRITARNGQRLEPVDHDPFGGQ